MKRIGLQIPRLAYIAIVASLMLSAVTASMGRGVGQTTSPYTLSLPLLMNPWKVFPTDVWTAELIGGETRGFLIDEPMLYRYGGYNITSLPINATVSWNQDGPCGPFEVYTGTVSLEPGAWLEEKNYPAPNCIGVYTHTLQFSALNITTTLQNKFVVNHPSSNLIAQQQGFDKCNIPSLYKMQTWWDESPYNVVNLYIGGSNRACANSEMDAVWIYEASKMGWSFIPTWVGPQSPCFVTTKPKISLDPKEALEQGKGQAEEAAYTARRLGLMGERIIYYDIEGYNATTACRVAVDNFMQGWSERLQELGLRAGAYGSPFRSYVSDWANNENPPDDIWYTHWVTDTYDAEQTVWSPYLPVELWPDSQRIKQYAGDHYETWGGLSIHIDSNVLDGHITGIIPPDIITDVITTPLTTTLSLAVDQFMATPDLTPGISIERMGMVSTDQGWATIGGKLHWTSDAGRTWQTVPGLDGQTILDGYFINEKTGWFAARSSDLAIWRTNDGGKTWEYLVSLPVSPEMEGNIGTAYLDFVDPQTGWLVLKFATNSNFSQGVLFRTDDGGRTWHPENIPFAEPVNFIDQSTGWVAGGPSGSELYATYNGGISWQPVTSIPANTGEELSVGLPEFTGKTEGYVRVTHTGEEQSSVDIYKTSDEGRSWSLDSVIETRPDLALQTAPALLLMQQMQASALSTTDVAVQSMGSTMLPEGVVDLEFHTPLQGWALVQEGVCTGYKTRVGERRQAGEQPFQCQQISRLLLTTDGGVTWTDITPK